MKKKIEEKTKEDKGEGRKGMKERGGKDGRKNWENKKVNRKHGTKAGVKKRRKGEK